MKITDVAIQNRKPVYLLLLILITVGVYCYSVLPRESSPDIAIPYIFVTTSYEGVAPSDIETLITLKIEKKLKGLSDVEEIRSVSSEGLSFISVEFKPGIEIDVARQRVRDKVDEAKPEIPTEVDDPTVEEMNFSEFPILIVSLYGMEDMGRLKKLAENVQDEVETIPGVLSAELSGDLERVIRVEVDLDRLNEYNLRLDEVIAAIQEENVNVPSGSMDIGEGRFLVRVPGEFESPEEVYSLPVSVKPNGSIIYLSDITRVKDTFKDVQSIARINGEPCVLLTIKKRAGENAIYIVDAVKKLLGNYRFPEGVKYELSFDESRSIKNMVSDLENSIISGLLLVVLVIFLFMGLKNAFFVGMSIPYSMCISFAVLEIMGITLNTMVLFALVLVLGMFVDNSVVMVENIYRHMGVGKSSGQAASEAAKEVGWPVITSTLTTVAAFFPMLFWPGIMGEFMSYLPLVVIIALTASLFIAIVINPAIAAKFMHYHEDEKAFAFDLSPDRGLLLRYRKIVSWAVNHSKLVILAAFGFLVFTFVLYGLVGKGVEFFPETDPRRAFVIVEMPEGTNIHHTDEFIAEIETYLKGYPEIISYSTAVGAGASTGDNHGGSGGALNRASISIDFVNKELRKKSSAKILSEVRQKCKKLYGADIEVKGEEEGPPSGKPINVEVSGDKYEVLEEIATRIKEVVKTCQGTVDIGDDYEKGKPEFNFRLDRKKAFAYGISTARAALVIKSVVNGVEVGKYREGDDEYDIIVRGSPELRKDLSTLENIKINNMAGVPIALSSIGKFSYESGSGAINRIDNSRVISVFSEVEGRLASDILIELQEKLKDFVLPEGYTLSFTGENEEQQKAQAFLSKAMLSAVFLIALILVSQFNSYTQPFIILSSVVLSIGGVLWGLLITGAPFGVIMTGIGIISLAGVVVNNAIVLIDYTNLLVREGMGIKAAAVESGIVRFRPVILTAVTTVLGLVPMALGVSIDFVKMSVSVGTETSQYWGPMASAIIAGLIFATVLTLVVVPCLYVLLTKDKHAQKGPSLLKRAGSGVVGIVKKIAKKK